MHLLLSLRAFQSRASFSPFDPEICSNFGNSATSNPTEFLKADQSDPLGTTEDFAVIREGDLTFHVRVNQGRRLPASE
jgi:hypothetical protein